MKRIHALLEKIKDVYKGSKNVSNSVHFVILVVMILAVAVSATKPTFAYIYNLAKNLNEIHIVEKTLTARIDGIGQSQKIIQSLSPTSIEHIKKALPDNVDLPSFVTTVEKIASDSNVAYKGISSKNFTLDTTPAAYSDLKEQLVTIQLQGDYSGIKNFLLGLENSARNSQVNKITLTHAGKNGLILADLELKVFYIR